MTPLTLPTKEQPIELLNRQRWWINYYNKNLKQLGKLAISVTNLHVNKLLVKYNSGGTFRHIKSTVPISAELAQLLIELFETHRINIILQQQLNEKDTQYLDILMKFSQLGEMLEYKLYVKNIADYVDRFKILRGGFMAGNYAPELVKELHGITALLSNPVINRIKTEDALFITELLNESQL